MPQQGRDLIAKFVSERPHIKSFIEDIEKRLSTKP
jgi:hypothetical protein